MMVAAQADEAVHSHRPKIPARCAAGCIDLVFGSHRPTYPAQIKVTERSCADPANSAQITFQQATFCVTPAERQTWDNLWLNSYVLMFLLVASVVFIGVGLPRERRGHNVRFPAIAARLTPTLAGLLPA
ncbi:MAG: hypothetical protein H0W71_04215 [Sphingomonas sp.]|nr:hypothetical protein [Sphingomonas sp.]